MLAPPLLVILLLCSYATADVAATHKRNAEWRANVKRAGASYMGGKAEEENVISLESGMLVEILKDSDKESAKSPRAGDKCRVTYSGTLPNGTPFDAGTATFSPDEVISGWTEAMQLMTEGDKWRLHIPYDMAYGSRGYPPKIPPFSPLVFELEIHEVKGGKGKSIIDARAAFNKAKARTARSD